MNHLTVKITDILLIFILVSVCIFNTSCSCNSDNKNNGISVNEATPDEYDDIFPVPVKKTWEKSDNSLGARYIFTLEEFCERLQETVKDMGVSVSSFKYDDWKVLSENLIDDSGIEYSTYYYSTDSVAFTVAVENVSKKVMNVGCGCSYEMFADESEDYQYSVLTMTALVACVAGGYDADDLDFLYTLIVDVTKNTKSIYFNNNVYLVNYDENENSSVLFMISAISDEKTKEWDLIDYKEYKKESST